MRAMLSESTAKKILNKVITRKTDFADIFAEHSTKTFFTYENKQLKDYVTGISQGAAIRLVCDNSTTFAYTSELTEKKLLEIAHLTPPAPSLQEGVWTRV